MKKEQNKWSFRKELKYSSDKRCRSWTHERIGFVLMILTMLMSGQKAWGYNGKDYEYFIPSSIIIDKSTLQEHGYFTVTVPIYDDEGMLHWDEAAVKIGEEVSTISFEGGVCLSFYAVEKKDDWNKKNDYSKVYCKMEDGAGRVEIKQGESLYKPISDQKFERYSGFKQDGINRYYSVFRIYPRGRYYNRNPENKDPKFTYKINVTILHTHSDNQKSATPLTKIESGDYKLKDITPNVDINKKPGYRIYSIEGRNFDESAQMGDGFSVRDLETGTEVARSVRSDGWCNAEVKVHNAPRKLRITFYTYPAGNVPQIGAMAIYHDIDEEGYQFPDTLITSYKDEDNGKIRLSWQIEKSNDDTKLYVGGDDKFEIERSEAEDFSKPTKIGSIAYVKNQETYEFIDDAVDENLNGKFYYRLRRSEPSKWNWGYIRHTDIDLKMTHLEIDTATAVIGDDQRIHIKWDYKPESNVISNNTKIILREISKESGVSNDYVLEDEDIEKQSCTVALPSTCKVYKYEIYVKPGSDKYKTQKAKTVGSDEELITVYMGKITKVNASKGYYSDHVALEWETDGKTIEVFSIQSRIYGSGNDFKQIDQVSGNMSTDALLSRTDKQSVMWKYVPKYRKVQESPERAITSTTEKIL